MDPWNVNSVDSLATLSDLLRVVSDEKHPGYTKTVNDVDKNIEKYIAKLFDSLEFTIKNDTLEALFKKTSMQKENIGNTPVSACLEPIASMADEMELLFHRMDVLFLFLYTDKLKDKQRLYDLLSFCFFGSSLQSHDKLLCINPDWFDCLKGVRKGVFVLSQVMSILLGNDVKIIDNNPVDGTNALFTLSSALYHQNQVDRDLIVAKSLPMALEWMIDILESPFCHHSLDYPNAIGVKSVMRDLLFKLLFYYERFDVQVTGLVCKAMSRCHQDSAELCDSLWTSEDRDVLIAFITGCLVSDELPFFLDDYLIDLLASISCSSIGAEQVGQLLLSIPMLSASRSPDRHWVEESFSSSDNRILLLVEKKGGLRLSIAGVVGVILPEGTTGSQRDQEANVLWNVHFSAYEFMYRLLDSDKKNSIIRLLSSLLIHGFHIPAPQIEPLFEKPMMEQSLFNTFAIILRQSLDEGCSSSLLVDLLNCLKCSRCDGDDCVILAELDLLSGTTRGLFHVLAGVDVHVEEQAGVLIAFFDLLARHVSIVPKDLLFGFIDGFLASTHDYPNAFLSSLGQLISCNSVLNETSRVYLKKYDLINAFIKCIPNCIAGVKALLGNDTLLDKRQIESIVSNLPLTSGLLADIIRLSIPINLDAKSYSRLAQLADDDVLDAIGGMANKDRQRHHLTQFRALGLMDQLIGRTDSVLFLHVCNCTDKKIIEERAIPRLCQATNSIEEKRAILELALDNAINVDVEAILESAPELANVVVNKKGDASIVSMVLKNSKALASILISDAFLSLLSTISIDNQMVTCLKQCSQLEILQIIIPHFPDSDLFLELVEEESLIISTSLKVIDSTLLRDHLRMHGLLHLFFTRSSLADPRLVQLLSKHRVLARELVSMGLLEAIENYPTQHSFILFDAMLACLDDTSSADRITALLKMQLDSSPNPFRLLADMKVLELLIKLQRSNSLKAQHWVKSLCEDVLTQVVAAYAADTDAMNEKTCLLALTLLQESGWHLTDALMKRLLATQGTVGEFVKLLFN